MTLDRHVLDLDPAAECARLEAWLRQGLKELRKPGVVLGISGGVDSAVCLALCVRAVGAERVIALMLPEQDSDPWSERLARDLAAQVGVEPVREDVTPALRGFGCYARRDEAIRRVIPAYDPGAGWTAKLVLPPGLLDQDSLNVYTLKVVSPDGEVLSRRVPPADYAQIVAASNFKQRSRSALLYYHAELRNFAVVGTPNKNEHDQGFFVKFGDGGVDLAPIGHLYKTQVYQLAAHLEVPEAIRTRVPTSDTYSAPSTQEEFFFRLPFETMDLLWYAQAHGYGREEAAEAFGLTPEQVGRAYADFTRKARTTDYLRTPTRFPEPAR